MVDTSSSFSPPDNTHNSIQSTRSAFHQQHHSHLNSGEAAHRHNGCILFHRSDRSDRSEQKFAVLFHHSEQSDRNVPCSFSPIRSLRSIWFCSEQSDRAFRQARQLSFVYIFTAEGFTIWRIFSGILIEITFNWPTITKVCLFRFIRPKGQQQQQHHRYLHRH